MNKLAPANLLRTGARVDCHKHPEQAEAVIAAMAKQIVEMRLQYAGVVGLLCRLSPWAEEDDRDSIEQAALDWTIVTGNGWGVSRHAGGVMLLDPEQNAKRTDL